MVGSPAASMAALHERDHTHRLAARADAQSRQARGASSGGLNLDASLSPKTTAASSNTNQATAPATGVGWILVLAGLVFLAMHASSSAGSASHSGRGLGRRFGASSLIGYAQTVDELKAFEQMDRLISGDLGEALRSNKARGDSSRSRQQTCTARLCAVGAKVALSPAYASYSDAALGPLEPGQEGVVVKITPRWITVEAPGSELGWLYKKQALSPAAAGNADASEMSVTDMTHTYPTMTLPKHAPAVVPAPAVDASMAATTAICLVLLAVGGGIAVRMRDAEQQRLNIEYEQREAKRLLDIAKYREQQVAELRAARITTELEAEVARKEKARQKGAVMACQHIFRQARGRDDASLSVDVRASAANAARARGPSWSSPNADGSDPLNGGTARFIPTQRPGEPVTVGLWEAVEVSGPLGGARKLTGRAHLDTGNASLTLMTSEFAASLGLIDEQGLPYMVSGSAVERIKTQGVVQGVLQENVVCPAVTFSIKGVEVTTKVAISPPAGLGQRGHRWDLLVCMDDIKKFERYGAAFRPCKE